MDSKSTFGPGPHTLLSNGQPVAPVAVAEDSVTRGKGLLGTDAITGALWITRCPSVHMVGMRYPIDAATLDRDGRVLAIKTIRPWVGVTWPRRGGTVTVEAAAGSMSTWGITVGTILTLDRDRDRAGEDAL